MANSICPKCGGTQFESAPLTVRGESLRPTAIQCASCGAIIGLIPGSSEVGKELEKSLAGMQKAMAELIKRTGK